MARTQGCEFGTERNRAGLKQRKPEWLVRLKISPPKCAIWTWTALNMEKDNHKFEGQMRNCLHELLIEMLT